MPQPRTAPPPTGWQTRPFGDRYAAQLAERAEGLGGEPKRERTRARLKLAAFQILNAAQGDLTQLTVAAVTRAAGVATGTFYVHFTATRELLAELVAEFVEVDIQPNLPAETGTASVFERTREMFVDAVRSFRTLRGFFAAIIELRRSDDEVNRIWLAITLRWGSALAEIARRHDPGFYSATCMEMLGQAASGAADELLKSIYIDEIFGPDFAQDPGNDLYVAELLALIRHRILFGRDPDPAQVSDWCRAEGRMIPLVRPAKLQAKAKP